MNELIQACHLPMRRGLLVLGVAASVGMARGQMGLHEPWVCRYLSLILLAGGCLLGSRWTRRDRPGLSALLVAILAGIIFVFELRSSPALLIVPLLWGAFATDQPHAFRQLAGASLLFEIADLLRWETTAITRACSAASAALSGGHEVLGPGPMAAGVWIWAACLGIVSILERRYRWKPLLIATAALIVLFLAQVHVQNPWLAVMGVSVVFGLLLREEGTDPRTIRGGLVAAGLAIGAGLLLLFYPARGPRENGPILLRTPGLFSLDEPVHGVYGSELTHGPYLGLMSRFLRASGFPVETRDGALTARDLERCHILMVVNPRRPFEAEEARAIEEFVRGGGSLLLVGEHTNVDGVAVHSNALLASTGIRLNDDTAVPFGRNSFGVEWSGHPACWGARGEADFQQGMGCTLEVRAPARPLLTARTGFSDAGDPANLERAYLGNMHRDPRERAGDVVLAAEARLGKGKVVVFGDSLTFQNGLVPRAWPFILRLFDDLARRDAPRSRLPGLILVAAGALLIVLLREARAIAVGAAGLILIMGVVEARRTSLAAEPIRNLDLQDDVALIDWTGPPARAKIGGEDPDSIEGLVLNLMRNGFLPLCRMDDALPARTRLLILPASARPHSLTPALLDFMRKGGFVMATVGEPEAGCLTEYLEWSGLRLFPKPLGPGGKIRTVEEKQSVKFYSAWPVLGEGKDLLPLALAWDYPVIQFKPHGAGGFILVGDTFFLASKNLESYETYSKENIEFFRTLCGLVKGQK